MDKLLKGIIVLKRLGRLRIALLGLAWITVATAGLVTCCKPKITASAKNIDGLPANWNGTSDYESEGWGFEAP